MAKNRKKSRFTSRLILLLLFAIILLGAVWFIMSRSESGDALDPNNTVSVIVEIPSGSTTGKIADILVENQIIESAQQFKVQSKMKGYDGSYKAGAYSLSPSMTMDEIMNVIISGKAATMRFTIPEGYTVKETAEKLARDGFGSYDAFMNEIQNGIFDYAFINYLPAGENRLEGFLFPNTYDVYTNVTEHQILDRMLKQFDSVFTSDAYARAESLGYNVYDIVTIASMIERETRVDSERGKVASVIYNRLKIGMKLRIDATVQYALGKTKDRLYYDDLKVDSPYNTYLVEGLPAGPICSPGEASIHAALYPEETNYLFYVLKPELDGSHNFAENDQEFTKYRNQYLDAVNSQ